MKENCTTSVTGGVLHLTAGSALQSRTTSIDVGELNTTPSWSMLIVCHCP
ncbi:hypothetical protein RISK_006294 [Rhodopirellula islandica]|uniref:Uncharacterized protein n=1 Tax=Rhodopirellula islandica TaxID=595434 RepID=A0A0J1E895_RHOIS|nr:hypothetical protein RISK_006294 [Rhodopirellula islandica]